MRLPTIPPRVLLAIRIAQFFFGVTALALSAASVQIVRGIPRPASSDNILLITANAFGLLTTLYNIVAHRLKQRNPVGKHRIIPYSTESATVALLLAAFLLGAISTARGRGACETSIGGGGDGDDDRNVPAGVGIGSGTACRLTKASTSFTVFNLLSFVLSLYTLGKGAYDETR